MEKVMKAGYPGNYPEGEVTAGANKWAGRFPVTEDGSAQAQGTESNVSGHDSCREEGAKETAVERMCGGCIACTGCIKTA